MTYIELLSEYMLDKFFMYYVCRDCKQRKKWHFCLLYIILIVYSSDRLSVCTGDNDEDDDWEQALIDEYLALQQEQKEQDQQNS